MSYENSAALVGSSRQAYLQGERPRVGRKGIRHTRHCPDAPDQRWTGAPTSLNLHESRKDDTLPYRHLQFATLTLAVLALAIMGCSPKQVVPRHTDDVPGYLEAPPELAGLDPSPLRGRRIVIDPGHGGHFPGAVGDQGLTEAEVNLGVALYLQGLLQWAGAEVHLTRSANVDFLTPADSSLTADLAARIALVDSLLPDVLVSIHHNSTASRDPEINETQTYYPIGREGADLDLARAIHRHLVMALEIEPAKILPGGFYMLRNAPVPAVLGEPAMLSNPVIEGRLSRARSLELEASAYFLGLHEFFAGGTPSFVSDLADTVVLDPDSGPLTWTFDPGYPGAPGLDPTSVSFKIDGQDRPFSYSTDGQTVSARVPATDLPATVQLSARNLVGRAAEQRQFVVGPPQFSHLRSATITAQDQAGETSQFLVIYESLGFDLAGFQVLTASHGTAVVDLPLYPGDRGWYLVDDPADQGSWESIQGQIPHPVTGSPLSVSVTQDAAESSAVAALEEGMEFCSLACDQRFWPGQTVPGTGWRSRFPLPSSIQGLFNATNNWCRPLLDDQTPVFPIHPDRPFWLEANGALPLVRHGHARQDSLVWEPLVPSLIGRRVALDPRGGGGDDQGRGPFGTRGSDLNLQVARRLASLLQGAGCEVEIVREGEIWTPDSEKVRRADHFGAHLYLALGRGTPTVKHHPGSRVGAPMAEAIASTLTPLMVDTLNAETAYDYVLRHTACPAVVIQLETPRDTDTEDRLTTPSWQDAVARALFGGVVQTLAPEVPQVQVSELLQALGHGAIPLSQLDLVQLDGNFQWLPPSGHSSPSSLPSWGVGDPGLPVRGDHHILELRAGSQWQLWAVERQPEGDWHGRVLLENR